MLGYFGDRVDLISRGNRKLDKKCDYQTQIYKLKMGHNLVKMLDFKIFMMLNKYAKFKALALTVQEKNCNVMERQAGNRKVVHICPLPWTGFTKLMYTPNLLM